MPRQKSTAPTVPATQATTAKPVATFAAIDMGSNSFRLEVATLVRGKYKRLLYLKETVRLGAGLDEQGHLTPEAMAKGLQCLSRFADALTAFPGVKVGAVATQTLREAQNRDTFLALCQPVLGHPIEVISGREEARLIYAGVARLQPSDAPRLVVDIGGRSTEMIIGQGRTPLKAESFQVGSVGLTLRYFPDGRLTADAFRAAQVAAGAELEEALQSYQPQMWQEVLGASGTVAAVAQLLAAGGHSDGHITRENLRTLITACIEAGHIDHLRLPGLKEDRRAVVAAGLCILYTLLMNFGIDTLVPTRGALRQGVIFDLYERHTHPATTHTRPSDLRERAVLDMQQRFQVDLVQSKEVTRVAGQLWRSLWQNTQKESAGLSRKASTATRHTSTAVTDDTLAQELHWASALHEVGMAVSHHDYHRHSAYLVEKADIAGFSQSQQERLARLVLGQRGKLRKVETLLAEDNGPLQLLCLRLAVLLCHAREGVSTLPELQRQGAGVRIKVSVAWRMRHPRTAYLLAQEVEAWAKVKALDLSLSLA